MVSFAELANSLGIAFDDRSRLDVILDMRKTGKKIFPAMGTSGWVDCWGLVDCEFIGKNDLMPLAGISNVTTVGCNETGQYSIYESDRFGFNNPDSIYNSKTRPILVIGDSFVHGHCVPRGKDVAGRLRQLGKPAINLGMQGNGPLLELATLVEYGLPLKPKMVLWVYFEGNDLAGVNHEHRAPILKRYFTPSYSQNLVNRQKEVDEELMDISNFLEKKRIQELKETKKADTRTDKIETSSRKQITVWGTKAFKFISLFQVRKFLTLTPETDLEKSSKLNKTQTLKLEYAAIAPFKKILKTAKTFTENAGGQLVFVYLKGYESLKNEAPHRKKVVEMVENLQVPIFDFGEYLKEQENPKKYFPLEKGGGHYNEKGYDLLARYIARSVLVVNSVTLP